MLCRYGSLMKRGNRLAKQTIWGNCSRWRENSKCKCSGAGPGLAGLSETSGAEGECWEVRGKGVNRVGPPKTGPSMVTSLPFIWKWTAGGRSWAEETRPHLYHDSTPPAALETVDFGRAGPKQRTGRKPAVFQVWEDGGLARSVSVGDGETWSVSGCISNAYGRSQTQKRVHNVWFHLYQILDIVNHLAQQKVVWRQAGRQETGRGLQGSMRTLWGDGEVSYLDSSAGLMSVYASKLIQLSTWNMCSLLYVNSSSVKLFK